MKSIICLIIASITAFTTTAETTVAVLEFGRGGTVRRTSSSDQSTPDGAASFFDAMHRSTKAHRQHASMSLVPDIFNRADTGIVVGLSGAGITSMPSAMNLLAEGAADVVGRFITTGTVSDVIDRVSKTTESITNEFERRLVATAEKTTEDMQVVSLSVDEESASDADKQLERMLSTLKSKAVTNNKTYIVHLVIDTPSSRRRLQEGENEQAQNDGHNEEAQDDAVNQYGNSYYYGQKTMFEIQNFNVIAWTTVGLVVLVMYVMSHFVAMPLMPDTLLHGEAAKFGTD